MDLGEEDIGVDAGFEQTDSQELPAQEGADGIGGAFGMPVIGDCKLGCVNAPL